MTTLTLELPPQKTQTAFNLRRWAELLLDPELARLEGRVETNRHGHIVLNPLATPSHGALQAEIGIRLQSLLDRGRVMTECPISTADGVKGADVAWASPKVMAELGDRVCFPRTPEICVEVISPGNTDAELREKKALYFDAGAKEFWTCSESGEMSFFSANNKQPLSASQICPEFPNLIKLR